MLNHSIHAIRAPATGLYNPISHIHAARLTVSFSSIHTH